MITDYSIQAVAINAIPLIFAITIHEAAHGYAARQFGDNTAYMLGRVSLNPIKHIDPVGTILIPLLLILSGSPFLVGYAKPVPVNFGRLRNPRIDSIWVALAGPGSNFIQALIWLILLIGLVGFGINEKFFISMSQAGIIWNLGLLVFNLFPLPPLDGGRILAGLLPARQFGDNTAYMLGRVSLNPIKHIDPVGTILIPLLLILSGSPFLVGYAKPVPVNFGRLRNPRIDSIWVALAGPGSNFIQALIWLILLIGFVGLGINEKFLISMSQAGITWNLGLLVFNLFPLPPLDGGRILAGLLPARQSIALGKLEPWGFFIVLGLVFTGIIGSLWMTPLMAFFEWLILLLTSPLRMIF